MAMICCKVTPFCPNSKAQAPNLINNPLFVSFVYILKHLQVIKHSESLFHSPLPTLIRPLTLNNALRFQFGDLLINATP